MAKITHHSYPLFRKKIAHQVVFKQMKTDGARLIGVYKADGGLIGELRYLLGHLLGRRQCSLCDITHSPLMKKQHFRKFEARLQEKHGLQMRLVHMNERTGPELLASKGREPCVLLEYRDGSISMFLDYEELKAAGGRVSSFEKLVESRLSIYL